MVVGLGCLILEFGVFDGSSVYVIRLFVYFGYFVLVLNCCCDAVVCFFLLAGLIVGLLCFWVLVFCWLFCAAFFRLFVTYLVVIAYELECWFVCLLLR